MKHAIVTDWMITKRPSSLRTVTGGLGHDYDSVGDSRNGEFVQPQSERRNKDLKESDN